MFAGKYKQRVCIETDLPTGHLLLNVQVQHLIDSSCVQFLANYKPKFFSCGIY